MEWIAIRSVYHFGVNKNGINIFEERVVVFEARDFKEAHLKAEKEAENYSKNNGFIVHHEQLAYKQDGSTLIDGYEVWSALYEAPLSLYQFYEEHYDKYLYHAENA